ncbi:MAG: hypothetical protein IJY09_02580 [Lachnospiraceae bacterium]|nr:hypothetical protein [Lachnospiraceae bacterium]
MGKANETPKKKKILRGESGYIDEQKKRRLLRMFMHIGIGVAIFILGLCLNKFEKNNIFTVIAVLMVLPAARALINFIALAPYRSVAKERVAEVQKHLKGADVMFTDMVFSSTDKIMFCSFLVIKADEIFCLAEKEKEDISYIEKYLKDGLKKRQLSYKLYITKDSKNYLEKIAQANAAEEVPEEVTDYLRSLMV